MMGTIATTAFVDRITENGVEERQNGIETAVNHRPAHDLDGEPTVLAAGHKSRSSDDVTRGNFIQNPGLCPSDLSSTLFSGADINTPHAARSISTFLGVSLHAITRDLKIKTEFVKDSVYELVREDDPDVEFIFFHGLQADPEDTLHAFWRTWKMRFTEECWLTSLLPKLLNYTEREIKPRVLSVTYENSSKVEGIGSWFGSSIDQFDTSEKLIQGLVMSGRRAVGQRYNVPVILVGHDLGGIMIKHFLMKVKRKLTEGQLTPAMKKNLRFFWENLSALVFYATPQVEYPTISEKIPRHSKSPSLLFLKALGEDAARVNKAFENFKKFENLKSGIPTLRIWESAKTTQGRIRNEFLVPKRVERGTGEDFTARWEDHFQVCQPTGVHSFTARNFARFVVKLIEDLRQDDHLV